MKNLDIEISNNVSSHIWNKLSIDVTSKVKGNIWNK